MAHPVAEFSTACMRSMRTTPRSSRRLQRCEQVKRAARRDASRDCGPTFPAPFAGCAGSAERMASVVTAPDSDVLGTLAVAMSQSGMTLTYLSLSNQTKAERAALVLLCTQFKSSFWTASTTMSITQDKAKYLVGEILRAKADIAALAAATKVLHVSRAALADAVITMIVCEDFIAENNVKALLFRVTLVGDLACLRDLIEIYMHRLTTVASPPNAVSSRSSVFLDCLPYAILQRRPQHLLLLLKAHMRVMQEKAEQLIREENVLETIETIKSFEVVIQQAFDKSYDAFGDQTALMLACSVGDETCVKILLVGLSGTFATWAGKKSITVRASVDQQLDMNYWPSLAVRLRNIDAAAVGEWYPMVVPPGATALMLAVRKGHLGCARLLLQHTADITLRAIHGGYGGYDPACDGDVMTAVILACEAGHVGMLELLLRHGATVDARCLRSAAHSCSYFGISMFNNYRHDPTSMHGSDESRARCLRILLESGKVSNEDLKTCDLPLTACFLRTNCIKIIVDAVPQKIDTAKNCNTPLINVLMYVLSDLSNGWKKAMLASVAVLLEAKADPSLCNAKGQTPLQVACCSSGSVECVRMLLKAGADPLQCTEKQENTPLHHAVFWNRLDCMEAILVSSPNAHAAQNKAGYTAFACACEGAAFYTDVHEGQQEQLIALLLRYRADVNIKDNCERTPLHLLASCRTNAIRATDDTIRLLLQHEANLNAEDNAGLTPLSYACGTGNLENIAALLQAGAKRHPLDLEKGRSAFSHAINLSATECQQIRQLLDSDTFG